MTREHQHEWFRDGGRVRVEFICSGCLKQVTLHQKDVKEGATISDYFTEVIKRYGGIEDPISEEDERAAPRTKREVREDVMMNHLYRVISISHDVHLTDEEILKQTVALLDNAFARQNAFPELT